MDLDCYSLYANREVKLHLISTDYDIYYYNTFSFNLCDFHVHYILCHKWPSATLSICCQKPKNCCSRLKIFYGNSLWLLVFLALPQLAKPTVYIQRQHRKFCCQKGTILKKNVGPTKQWVHILGPLFGGSHYCVGYTIRWAHNPC